jgi:hypothetical protein
LLYNLKRRTSRSTVFLKPRRFQKTVSTSFCTKEDE